MSHLPCKPTNRDPMPTVIRAIKAQLRLERYLVNYHRRCVRDGSTPDPRTRRNWVRRIRVGEQRVSDLQWALSRFK